MRLLVTRPEPDASGTAARLRALGHEVLVQPMLTVVFNPAPRDLPSPRALILTSRNGMRAVATWPQASAWRDLPVFVTGPATATEARAAGFANVRHGDRDAAALVDLILRSLPRVGKQILYIAGRDRAGGLSGGLSGLGYDIRTVEAYRTEPPERLDDAVRNALSGRALDGALFYSRRTASAFASLVAAAGLGAKLEGLTLYALSQSVAEPLQALGGAKIKVAPEPNSDALLGLVAEHSAVTG
jgi:uroporphyrinogen-III synthase